MSRVLAANLILCPSALVLLVSDADSAILREDGDMADPQSTQTILTVLQRVVGESVEELQVLGVNSLKSLTPTPQDLAGATITDVAANGRSVTIELGDLSVFIDLQRTGRLTWLDEAGPAQIGRPGLPTIRMLLQSGSALDFTEPAKTKRISIALSAS